jgi:hypothetical protein
MISDDQKIVPVAPPSTDVHRAAVFAGSIRRRHRRAHFSIIGIYHGPTKYETVWGYCSRTSRTFAARSLKENGF